MSHTRHTHHAHPFPSAPPTGERSRLATPIPVRALALGLTLGLAACGGGGSDSTEAPPATDGGTVVTPPATGTSSTAGVLCDLSGSAYNSDPSVQLTAAYSWTCDGSARVLSSNGVPNHAVGTFPGPGNPNPIGAVATSASYTLAPAVAASPTAVITSGYALNGVKMEPATAGTCGNTGGSSCTQAGGTGSWNMEALGQTVFNFGTDENNAHVQPTGAYHYHGMPEGFITLLGKGSSTMTLTGWAPDGFPIYARYGYHSADDASSNVRVLVPSYRLKTQPDANRPSTSIYPMGTFTQDHEYVAGLGDLDECNGRSGATPEFPGGIYHYVITDAFPFMGRCVKGTAASIR